MCKYTKNLEPCIYQDLEKCIYCRLAKFQFNYSKFIKENVSFMYKPYTCPYYEPED